jgi:hypothetical protein
VSERPTTTTITPTTTLTASASATAHATRSRMAAERRSSATGIVRAGESGLIVHLAFFLLFARSLLQSTPAGVQAPA